MRRASLFILAALLLTSALCVPAFAKDQKFKAAYGTPTIDGILDAAYNQSEPYDVKSSKGDSYSKADIYYLWDENMLYVFADVVDDTPSTKVNTEKLADIWKTDCVEFGVNVTPDGEKGDPHMVSMAGIYLASVGYGSKMDVYGKINDIAAAKAKSVCVTKKTDKGWTVEAALRVWGDSGVTPKAGATCGIYNILHNDTNNDNARETVTYNDVNATGANYDTAKMDCIVLQAKPAVTTAKVTAAATAKAAASTQTKAAQTADLGVIYAIVCGAPALAALTLARKKKTGR